MGNCLAKKRHLGESRQRRYAAHSQDVDPVHGVDHNQQGDRSAGGQFVSRSSVPKANTLQHISEREGGYDAQEDPSNHPTATTIFSERSNKDKSRRKSHYDNPSSYLLYTDGAAEGKDRKRYSSCSSIFLDDSTVSQPNLKHTLKTVALAIYFHIKNRTSSGQDGSGRSSADQLDPVLEIFDERLHPISLRPLAADFKTKNPEHGTIYRFIRPLFQQAQLTAECAIVTLVYVERLLTNADFELGPCTWRRCTLGAIMLASKVWDDQAVWNVDFCNIMDSVTVEDMNALEKRFLELLQFNINVPSSVYAKYYFDLRDLAESYDMMLPLEPLSKERAARLEAMSARYKDKALDELEEGKPALRRSSSWDGRTPRQSIAILS